MSTQQQPVIREYRFSDGKLEQLADSIKSNIVRDTPQLTDRGIDAVTIAAFQDLIDAFKDTSTDTEELGEVSETVESKNEEKDKLIVAMRRIRTAAINKFGEGSPRYSRFGFTGIDRLKEDELPRAMRGIYRQTVKFLLELASEGISQIVVDEFLAQINTYDEALDAVEDEVKDRDEATDNRIIAGNALYKEVVRITNIGKDVFFTTSAAKYNDYVIENFVGSGNNLTVIAVYEDIIAASDTVNLGALNAQAEALRLEVLTTGSIEFGFSSNGTDFTGTTRTVNGIGSTTVPITYFNVASGSLLFLAKNLNTTDQMQYKVSVLS